MSQLQTEYFKIMGLGALLGIGSSNFSAASAQGFNQPLGYSPMSFKNIFKVAFTGSLTLPALVLINKKFNLANFYEDLIINNGLRVRQEA